MKAAVIYDSKHGNTEKVALVICAAIGGQMLHVGGVNPANLKRFELLIFGSPTHGGFPSEGIYKLLKIPLDLGSVYTAAFDTRTRTTVFGYAAPKMAKSLEKNGGILLALPAGFFVLGIKGPLMAGEIERAADWVKGIANQYQEK